MMKKLTAALLCLVLVLGFAVSANAVVEPNHAHCPACGQVDWNDTCPLQDKQAHDSAVHQFGNGGVQSLIALQDKIAAADGSAPVYMYIADDAYMTFSQVDESIVVPEGITVYLCMNGQTITAAANAAIPVFQVEGTLYLCSCKDGALIDAGTPTESAIEVKDGGTCVMHNIDMEADWTSPTRDDYETTLPNCPAQGGAVRVGVAASFTMYQGKIYNFIADEGGAIAAYNNSNVTLNNVEIDKSSGVRDKNGRAYFWEGSAIQYKNLGSQGKLTIIGSTITGTSCYEDYNDKGQQFNRDDTSSKTVYLEVAASRADESFYILDSSISNNKATALELNDAKGRIINTEFSDNVASRDASGAYVYNCNVLFQNCTFTGNKTLQNDAGALVLWHDSKVELQDCTVTENVCDYEGKGIIYVHAGTLTLSGKTTVSDNKTDDTWGSGIRLGAKADYGEGYIVLDGEITITGHEADSYDYDLQLTEAWQLITLGENFDPEKSDINFVTTPEYDNTVLTPIPFVQRQTGSVTQEDLRAFTYYRVSTPLDVNRAGQGIVGQVGVVTAVTEDSNRGTVTGGGEIAVGTTTALTATPATGFAFDEWTWEDASGDEYSSNSNPFAFLLDTNADVTVTAHFLEEFDINVTANIVSNGFTPFTVDGGAPSASVGTVFLEGSDVTIEAAQESVDANGRKLSFVYWADAAGEQISMDPKLELIDVSADHVYQAVYAVDILFPAVEGCQYNVALSGIGVYVISNQDTPISVVPGERIKVTVYPDEDHVADCGIVLESGEQKTISFGDVGESSAAWEIIAAYAQEKMYPQLKEKVVVSVSATGIGEEAHEISLNVNGVSQTNRVNSSASNAMWKVAPGSKVEVIANINTSTLSECRWMWRETGPGASDTYYDVNDAAHPLPNASLTNNTLTIPAITEDVELLVTFTPVYHDIIIEFDDAMVIGETSKGGYVRIEGLESDACLATELRGGSEITVDALPNENYQFVKWEEKNASGEYEEFSKTQTITVQPDGDTTYRAVFEPATRGIDIYIAGNYQIGARPTLKVRGVNVPFNEVLGCFTITDTTPDIEVGGDTGNYQFAGWYSYDPKYNSTGSGPLSTDKTFHITPETESTLYCYMVPKEYTLKLEVAEGVGSVVADRDVVPYGSTANVEATPGEGYVFASWLDENGEVVNYDAQTQLEVEGDVTYYARFVPVDRTVKIQAASNQDSLGQVFDNQGRVFRGGQNEIGQQIWLYAAETSAGKFIGWVDENNRHISNNEYLLIVAEEDVNYTAAFVPVSEAQKNVELTILFPAEAGRVTAYTDSPVAVDANQTLSYPIGAQVHLSTGGLRYTQFDHWKIGNAEIKEAPYTIMMWKDIEVQAVFKPAPVNVTWHRTDGGVIGQAPESGDATFGAEYVIEAKPDPGCTFSHWKITTMLSDGTEKTQQLNTPKASFIVEGNLTIDAVFTAGVNVVKTGKGKAILPDGDQFPVGSGITVELVPDEGYHVASVSFTDANGSWECDPAETLQFTLMSDTTITVVFEADNTYDLTVKLSDPVGGQLAVDDVIVQNSNGLSTAVVPGATHNLKVDLAPGYTFKGWYLNDQLVSAEQTLTVTVNGDSQYVAKVEKSANLFSVGGVADPAEAGTISGSGAYAAGTQTALTFTPNTGYTFKGWYLNDQLVSAEQTLTVTVTGDVQYVAKAEKPVNLFTVSGSADPAAAGTVSGSGTYAEGTQAALTFTPNAGYTFKGWYLNDQLVSTEQTLTVTVTGDIQYVAKAEKQANLFAVSGSADPAGSGTVSGSGAYAAGTQVTLTFTPNAGYTFKGWYLNDQLVSTEQTLTVTVTGDIQYVAKAEKPANLFAVSGSADPAGSGTVSGSGAYAAGTQVTLTFTPNEGYVFTGWYENGQLISDAAAYTLTVTGERNLVARAAASDQAALSVLQHPADMDRYTGETAEFSASASGDGVTYQWQYRANKNDTWKNIDGATMATYRFAVAKNQDGWQFRCKLSDAYGASVVTNAATLTVNESIELPPTGDSFNAALWLAMLAISGVGFIFLRKRVKN